MPPVLHQTALSVVTSRACRMNLRQGVGTGAVLYYPALSHGAPSHQSDPQKAARKNALRDPRSRRTRLGRLLLGLLGTGLLLFLLVWYAVHHFDWAGPFLANSLARAVRQRQRGQARRPRLRGRRSRQPPAEEERAAQSLLACPGHCLDRATRSGGPVGRPWQKRRQPAARHFTPRNPGPALKEWSAPGDGEVAGPPRRAARGRVAAHVQDLAPSGQGADLGRKCSWWRST